MNIEEMEALGNKAAEIKRLQESLVKARWNSGQWACVISGAIMLGIMVYVAGAIR